jgi:hypothetical protein
MAHLAANAEARTEGLGGNSRIPVEYRQSISYPVFGLPGAGSGQKQGWRRIADHPLGTHPLDGKQSPEGEAGNWKPPPALDSFSSWVNNLMAYPIRVTVWHYLCLVVTLPLRWYLHANRRARSLGNDAESESENPN